MQSSKKRIGVLVLMVMLVCMGFVAITPVNASGESIPPPSGLVSWWPGDGNVYDVISGNHGTLHNGATFAPGYVTSGNGQAFSLDGVDDYIEISDNPSLEFGSDTYTFEIWFKTSTTKSCAPGLHLLSKWNGWGDYNDWVLFLHDQGGTNGQIYFQGRIYSDLTLIDDSQDYRDGIWHHVVITKTDTGSAGTKLYVDGSLKDSGPGVSFEDGPHPLRIGLSYGEGNDHTFPGLIDEVAIWDRSLTTTEIQSIYNAGSAGMIKPEPISQPPDLISWWPGDGNTFDIAGTNPGTLKNGAIFASGYVTSGNGQGFSFDGVDDYVDCGDDSIFTFGDGIEDNPFSLVAWINSPGITSPFSAIIAKDDGTNREYNVGVLPSGKVRIFIKDQGGQSQQSIDSTNTVTDSLWHFIVATYDGRGGADAADGFNLYIDGALETPTNTIKQSYTAMSDTIAPVTIGKYAVTGYQFTGEIDEAAIWNRALTPTEVQSIYDAGTAGMCKPGPILAPDDLIAWWPGDHNANDIIGMNHGLMRNGATFETGAVDWAFSLDGYDDYVEVPDNDLWTLGTNDFTIDLWACFDGDPGGTIRNPGAIMIGHDNGGGEQNKWTFPLGGGVLHFHVNGPSPYPVGGYDLAKYTFSPNPYQWYHLAVTRSGNTFTIYVDGIAVSSETNSVMIPNPTAPLTIGQAEGFFTDGRIDEVEFFNRALSPTEIKSIYNAGAAGKCKGQNIEIAPMTVEFGDVEVGTSISTLVTLSNTGIADLIVNSIVFEGGSSPEFSLASSHSFPFVISPDSTVDVEITFSPSAEGASSAVLQVISNDPDQPNLEVDLSGSGVITEVPPEQQIADILKFFDTSVALGTLEGNGNGNSANGRRKALRNMLEAASDLIIESSIEEACDQLNDALRRTDGNPRPPEFVKGTAAPELAIMIQNLIDTLSS
jgi:hypothetical protein